MSLSAETKRKLIGELGGIDAADDLMLWALRRLPLKNRLLMDDAREVEAAYATKLNAFGKSQSRYQAGAAPKSSAASTQERADKDLQQQPDRHQREVNSNQRPADAIFAPGAV